MSELFPLFSCPSKFKAEGVFDSFVNAASRPHRYPHPPVIQVLLTSSVEL